MRYFIGDLLDDPQLRVMRSRMPGLLTGFTSLDPFDVVHRLKDFALENPYQFRFAIRFTPLEVCVDTVLDDLMKAAEGLLSKIAEDESFRITVRRRHTELSGPEIITKVASVIPRRVDLDTPDKTLWIEVMGELTGMSVLIPDDDILSIMSMRDDQY